MRFEIGLSQRAYATRRGVSPKAVRKAIASGRIASAVLPDGTINADEADRLWEANTDPTQRRGKEADRATASMEALVARPVTPPVEDDAADEETAENPVPTPRRPSEIFEEDAPRRRARDEEDDAKFIELAEHIAANRARARASGNDGPAPGVPSEESAELAESLLALALEEKREKVRKLRLANDEKEKLLVSEKPTHAHYFALLRVTNEDWQNWPDSFGPNLAAEYNIDQRSLT